MCDWIYSTNIYEVNIRQYTQEGTFHAFAAELPRLKDMGIEVLWFMPVTPISHEKRLGSLGSYYACSDYAAVNPEYGTLDDFRHLVQSAHALGLKVIIDWVANHTGWDHRWITEHPDFYRRDIDGHFFDQHGWADVIDLNYDNKALWEAMLEAMRFWIKECDIDGFRCDMAMLVPLAFWRYVRTELDMIKPLFWLAECEEIDYHEVFDVTYAWKLLHSMEAYYRKETGISGLNKVLTYYREIFPSGALRTLFITNHDENSHSGSEYERLGKAVGAFAVLCCTWDGIPLIYSGQEMPLTRRLKFFDKDPIEWNGRYELHHFYKTLLTLRKVNTALRAGDTEALPVRLTTTADNFVVAFYRQKGNDSVLVLLNLSEENKALVHLSAPAPYGKYQNVFTGSKLVVDEHTGFHLPAWDYQVYSSPSERFNG